MNSYAAIALLFARTASASERPAAPPLIRLPTASTPIPSPSMAVVPATRATDMLRLTHTSYLGMSSMFSNSQTCLSKSSKELRIRSE